MKKADDAYFDDELKSTVPERPSAELLSSSKKENSNQNPNPFFFEKKQNPQNDYFLPEESDRPPERSIVIDKITNSPNVALKGKNCTRVKAGNPTLAKLSGLRRTEDMKSENAQKLPNQQSLAILQNSFISLNPGTPKSDVTANDISLANCKTKSGETISVKTKLSTNSIWKRDNSKEIELNESKLIAHSGSKNEILSNRQLKPVKAECTKIPEVSLMTADSVKRVNCCISSKQLRENQKCCIII